MDIGAVLRCFWDCVKRIPWWAWPLLIVVGALLGAITYYATVLSGGSFVIVAPALIKAVITGIFGAIGVTLLYCLLGCIPGRSPG
jgi:hypothetical protein